MQETLNQQSGHADSVQRLEQAYRRGLIAPEKKPFLIDLRRSFGPYLAVDGGGLICDGASQIASVGLGFNPGALFGAAEHLESWINLTCSPNFHAIRSAYEQLLQRKLGSNQFVPHFCASGAEAVETALAHLFDHRTNATARQVLAFEGSFHGRMMVALASTWNPAKREPFAWPSYASAFAPFPNMDHDEISGPASPDNWQALWCEPDREAFQHQLGQTDCGGDELLGREIESLRIVRAQLDSGNVFAMIIEPMQCEGGDRYASARFHQGLVYLSESFGIPLVYDEIQTGFGLGGEFFWHRLLNLRDSAGNSFFPAAVICAKKAQTGIALLRDTTGQARQAAPEQYSAASLVRGYIQASVVDQFQGSIESLEATNRQHLKRLAQRFAPHLRCPRAKGVSFAFDFETVERTQKFISHRFQHGLLYYPAGSKTARFRFNLGFKPQEIELFWQQLEAALVATFADKQAPEVDVGKAIAVETRHPADYYEFHEHFIARKLSRRAGAATANDDEALDRVRIHLTTTYPGQSLQVIALDSHHYPEYRARILDMQARVYEPARQSPPEEFDALFHSDNPIAILVLRGEEIVAMSFAGPLHLFAHQRGVPQDPYRDDPSVAYMLDLTVAQSFRGGLGAVMKQAMTLLAEARGVTAIHGRNRDRLAAGMWAINLSLGSFVSDYLSNDYPDNEPYRDCLYYRCPLRWDRAPIDLGSGIDRPLGADQLNAAFVREQLPSLVNKLTLSNFVTRKFLKQLEEVATIFPKPLRHVYASSGTSECVDKMAKVLWRHRQPRTRLLTITGSDFGCGSFLARSLSSVGDAMFEVAHVPAPTETNSTDFLDAVERQLQTDEMLGMFVEPLMRRTMTRLAPDTLGRVVELCRAHNTPLVYNDTASLFYRYSPDSFSASGMPGLLPDASFAFLGGQMALIGCSADLFLDQPLLLISTWEGDAFSLGQFHQAMTAVQSDVGQYLDTMSRYHEHLIQRLATEEAARANLHRGIGSVRGPLAGELADLLRHADEDHWISCPSYNDMRRFLTES